MQNEEIRQPEFQHNEAFYLTQAEAMTLLSAARYTILPPEARSESDEQFYKNMESAITKLKTQISYNKQFQEDTLEYDFIKKRAGDIIEEQTGYLPGTINEKADRILITDTDVNKIIDDFAKEYRINLEFDKVYHTLKALVKGHKSEEKESMYAFSHYYENMSLEDTFKEYIDEDEKDCERS